jgi:SEC-C motif domain protein
VLHVDEHQADTAEALMRSRFSAYAVEDADYIWRTWHPRTRPPAPVPLAGIDWVRLEILDVVDGQPGDETGVVEFRAHYREGRRFGVLHERSTFEMRARRWFYLDGEQTSSA